MLLKQISFLKKYFEYFLLLLFIIIGCSTASRYGYSWDEAEQRRIGEIVYNYLFNHNPLYLTYVNNDYGVIMELPLMIIEKFFGMTSLRNIFVMRHIVTHLFFLLSALYFFKLIVLLYNNKLLATIGFLLLVLNPLIYGHSFFNTKDVPFLSMYIICFYQFVLAFNTKKTYSFVLLAFFSGMLINFRIMGVAFVSFVIFFLLLDIITNIKTKKTVLKTLINTIVYCIITCFITIGFWPILWHQPITNFLLIFEKMSKFRWTGTVLFNGHLIDAVNLPWHYIPLWFTISNPLGYLIIGFGGICLFVFNFFKNIKNAFLTQITKYNLLFMLCFFVPVIAIIILKSVVYDSWRQLYFIYPPFILFAIYLINNLIQTKYKKIALSITGLSITSIAVYIILNFPLYHVFFNPLVSFHKNEYLRKNFEMDYWGLSFKQSLEYILKIDKSETINIAGSNIVLFGNADMMLISQKKHFNYVEIDQAKYFITNYRFHPEDYTEHNLKEIKSFYVLGNKVNTIFMVYH